MHNCTFRVHRYIIVELILLRPWIPPTIHKLPLWPAFLHPCALREPLPPQTSGEEGGDTVDDSGFCSSLGCAVPDCVVTLKEIGGIIPFSRLESPV